MEYDFKLPVSGKDLKWRPLKVEESLSERAAFKGTSEENVSTRLLMRRVFWYDGKEGMPADYGQWDELDLEFFGEEVGEKEGARRAALRKAKISPSDPMADFKIAVETLKAVLSQVGPAVTAIIETAKLAENVRDPLGSGRT